MSESQTPTNTIVLYGMAAFKLAQLPPNSILHLIYATLEEAHLEIRPPVNNTTGL